MSSIEPPVLFPDPQISGESSVARALAALNAKAVGRLRFPDSLEHEFWEIHHAAQQPRVRFALCLAFCTVLGFAALDHLLLGQPWRLPEDLSRFGVQLPVVLLAIWAASARTYRKLYVPGVRILAPVFALAAVVTASYSTGNGEFTLVSSRLVLATFFFYFMLGLSFGAALRTSIVVPIAYAVAAGVAGLPVPVAIYNLFILLCANLFAGAGSYALERANRQAFLEHKLLAEVASHDGLTGLLNRSAFESRVRTIWSQSVRDGSSVTVLMLDIDHFKAFNDRYGHQAGDDCLRRVAAAVRGTARRPLDVVARYGGEELIAVLPGSDRAHGTQLASELVAAVSALGIAHAGSATRPHVTISVGVVTVEVKREPSHESAIRLADRALYAAKEQGRDRAVALDRNLQVIDGSSDGAGDSAVIAALERTG